MAGNRIGDLRLLRDLGQGGLRSVYLAREASTGNRPVVVKLAKMGESEAHTLGQFDDDHIVPILWAAYDATTELHVVCMPFLGSATLHDVLDHIYSPNRKGKTNGAVILDAIRVAVRPGDPTPLRSASGPPFERLSFVDGVVRLAELLAEALISLHERNTAHCDLKPSNILLTPQGRPLLLDFNLSVGPARRRARSAGRFPTWPRSNSGRF